MKFQSAEEITRDLDATIKILRECLKACQQVNNRQRKEILALRLLIDSLMEDD